MVATGSPDGVPKRVVDDRVLACEVGPDQDALKEDLAGAQRVVVVGPVAGVLVDEVEDVPCRGPAEVPPLPASERPQVWREDPGWLGGCPGPQEQVERPPPQAQGA